MTTTTAPSAQAAGAEPGPTRPTKHTAPALLETTPDANTAIWTSHGHGDYNGHDITASIASDDTRRLWVSIAEADPLTPSDVRQLIAHLQYALTTLEGAPLNVDTYRAHATSPQRDGIIEAVVDETTDIDTIISVDVTKALPLAKRLALRLPVAKAPGQTGVIGRDLSSTSTIRVGEVQVINSTRTGDA